MNQTIYNYGFDSVCLVAPFDILFAISVALKEREIVTDEEITNFADFENELDSFAENFKIKKFTKVVSELEDIDNRISLCCNYYAKDYAQKIEPPFDRWDFQSLIDAAASATSTTAIYNTSQKLAPTFFSVWAKQRMMAVRLLRYIVRDGNWGMEENYSAGYSKAGEYYETKEAAWAGIEMERGTYDEPRGWQYGALGKHGYGIEEVTIFYDAEIDIASYRIKSDYFENCSIDYFCYADSSYTVEEFFSAHKGWNRFSRSNNWEITEGEVKSKVMQAKLEQGFDTFVGFNFIEFMVVMDCNNLFHFAPCI